MNPELLLTHFNRISDAPEAIPRMRQFILDLAVQGRLVDQDPTDEPALELLKRIQTQKARLLKEGKIKRHDPSREISASEIDYPLPLKWEPTRIGNLLTVIRGASPRPKGDPKYFSAERTPYHWIKISDIRKHSKDRVLCDTDEFLTKAGMEKSVLLPKDTLVVTNSATIGVPIFLGFEGGCIHDGYLAFPYFPTSELSKDFFFVLFQTLQSYAAKKARGMAQLNLNTELVREFPLGLPPFAEQRRIVAKVDELMTLCDRLEAAQRERETRRNRLAAASHRHLDNGADGAALRKHAHFYIQHLPTITTRPEQIPALRGTILSLAVRGQLVPQSPTDEPASELLKRVQAEIARLMSTGEAKEQKRFEEGRSATEPYDIPQTWVWVSLGQVAFGFRYGTSMKCSYERTGEPVLRIPNIDDGRINVEDLKFGPLPKREADALRLRLGDILMVRSNGSLNLVGRPALVEANTVGYCYAGYLVRVRTSNIYLNARYLLLALSSAHVRDQIEIPIRTTVGLKNVNATELSSLMIPLPPLDEQHRIVAKVEELMAVCDRLEEQLTTAQTETSRLLEAVLYHALNDSLPADIHPDRIELHSGHIASANHRYK